MSKTYIPVAVRRSVAAEAKYRCGYCLTSQKIIGQPMQLEHIEPEASGGSSDEVNLWLACALCNGHKSTKTNAIDPLTKEKVPLFNPRTQDWPDHFAWNDEGTLIYGQTSIGRATVLALNMNNQYVVPSRCVWVAAGWHPPNE
jgi:hypothetical protein